MSASEQWTEVSDQVRSLFALGALVAAAESESEVLAVIVDRGAELAGASAAVVGMVEGDIVQVAAHHGYPPGHLDPWRSFPLQPGLPMSDVIASGEAVYCSSREERDRRWPTFRGIGLEGSEAFVVLPLPARRGLVGALTLSYLGERDFEPDERAFLEAFAAQCALALETLTAYASERVARERTERLQRFTSRLAPALTVDDVAEIAIDKALVVSGGTTALLALEVENGRAFEIRRIDGRDADEMRTDELFPPDHPSVVGEVFRTRTALWLDRGEWERYPETIGRPDTLRSVAVVPVETSTRLFGVLAIAFDHERAFPLDERMFLEAIAAQTGQALDRARLYEQQSHIARVLQQSLLPKTLPPIPGVEVSTSYRAAGQVNEAGGDFYDLVETEAGHLLVIGDVCGKGPEAAALTSLCRYTLRAATLQGGTTPAQLLDLLNRAILADEPDLDGQAESKFASVTCVLLERSSGRLSATLASAGHPPTLIRRNGGAIDAHGAGGPPAGILAGTRYTEHTIALEPGDLIVLYTDGLTDALTRAHERLGEAPIREALVSLGDNAGPVAAIAVLERLLDGLEVGDDVAIVAAAVTC